MNLFKHWVFSEVLFQKSFVQLFKCFALSITKFHILYCTSKIKIFRQDNCKVKEDLQGFSHSSFQINQRTVKLINILILYKLHKYPKQMIELTLQSHHCIIIKMGVILFPSLLLSFRLIFYFNLSLLNTWFIFCKGFLKKLIGISRLFMICQVLLMVFVN